MKERVASSVCRERETVREVHVILPLRSHRKCRDGSKWGKGCPLLPLCLFHSHLLPTLPDFPTLVDKSSASIPEISALPTLLKFKIYFTR